MNKKKFVVQAVKAASVATFMAGIAGCSMHGGHDDAAASCADKKCGSDKASCMDKKCAGDKKCSGEKKCSGDKSCATK